MRAWIGLAIVVAGCSGGEPAATAKPPIDAAAWACLSSPIAIANRQPGPVTYVVPVYDFTDHLQAPQTVPGLAIMACASLDCAASDPGVSVSTDTYIATLTFPFGFDGWLKISAPGYVEVHYRLGGPMIGTPEGGLTVYGLPVRLLKPSTLQFEYSSLGVATPNGGVGLLMARTLSCARDHMAGVALGTLTAGVQIESTDQTAAIAYAIAGNGVFSPNLVSGDRGEVGLANVSLGSLDVRGVAPNDATYAAQETVVEADAITLIELRPGLGAWGQ